MKDTKKTKEQLLEEIEQLKVEISKLKKPEIELLSTAQLDKDADSLLSSAMKSEDGFNKHIFFFESLEKINHSIREAKDLDAMMFAVMEVAREIFKSDRTWLLYPCNPLSPTYKIPVESCNPKYPGAFELNIEIPMKPGGDEICAAALASNDPVLYGSNTDNPIFEELTKQFGVHSQIVTAVYPKIGEPWMFGMHQCSDDRIWSDEEQWLFKEIGQRIGDSLSSLLFLRNLSQGEYVLKKNQAHLQTLIETIPELVWMKDSDGVYLTCNHRFEQFFGASASEIIGKTDYDFVDKELADFFRQKDKEAIVAGKPSINEEEVVYASDGHHEILETIKTPIYDADGKIIGVLGVGRDITERKLSENKLKESEEKYRKLIDTTSEGFWLIDVNRKTIDVNNSLCEMLAYSKNEMLGKTPMDFVDDENLKIFDKEISKANKNKHRTYEIALKRKDGSIIHTLFNATSINDKNGKFAGSFAFVTDITDRKKIEIDLQTSEQDYRGLFENSHDAIIIFTPEDEVVLDVNERACELYGFSRNEFIGMSLRDITHNISVGEEQIVRTLKEGSFNQFETIQYKKDGSSFYLEINASVIQYKGRQAILSNNRDITDRKKTEAIVQESEEKFRSLYTSANDAIFLMKDSVFISCNPKTLEIFDCTEDEIIGYSPTGFSPEFQADGRLSKEVAMEKINATLAGEPQSFEWIHLKKNGIPFHAEISLNKIVLSDGVYVQAMVRDISQRKTAEEKQRISEERYRLISDLTSDYLFSAKICDDGNVRPTWVSGSFEKITGYTFEEYCAIGGWRAIIHEDDLEYDVKVFAELEKNQEILSVIRTYHKNGNIVWVKVYGHPIWDDKSNRLVGIIGAVEDITEQKRAEMIQSLQYNILFAVNKTGNLDELIGIIRKELGKLIDTTNFFVATYEEETDTIHLPYIADQKDTHTSFPAANSFTAHVIKTKKSLLVNHREIERFRKDNNINTVGFVSKIWLGVPMIIDGYVTGAIVVQSYEDENAYNSRDMEILEFVSHTIGISIERKKAEQNLKNALVKATESDRLKSAFLATMSHELRTPLNAIIGFSDIIDKHLALEDILKYTETINSSGNHLLTIVNDLFDITLIESGQTKIEKVDEELHAVLYEVYDVIKAEQFNINKTNLDLSLIIPSENTKLIINTDPSKLKQVLINLLKNALKFTDQGYVKFGYTIEKDNNKSLLKFYVKDSGIGVPEDKKEFIFDIFRQAQESYTKTHGGTGIGLTISKKLIELLGGKIWLESIEENLAEGQRGGTTFYFTIPFHEEVVTETLVRKGIKANSEIILNGKTVLVVEDVESSYEYLKVVLDKLGVNTLWATNGEKAIKLCKENATIDLVLMDINMPVMNGYEATQQIKTFKPDLPIIAQTAYAIVGDQQKSIDAGCDDYISKPIKRDVLIRKLKKYL